MTTYDDCSYCGGKVTEKKVKKINFWGEELTAIINNVPAGVCLQCGEKYYKSKVLKIIESLLKKKAFVSRVQVPVADYATAK